MGIFTVALWLWAAGIPASLWLWADVIPVSLRLWAAVIPVSLWLWAAVITESLWLWAPVIRVTLSFGLSVAVGNGRKGFFLNVPVCLPEAGFSVVEGAQFRQAACWKGQDKGVSA